MTQVPIYDERIKFLYYKIQNNNASAQEKREYIDLLLQRGDINQAEHQKYITTINSAAFAQGLVTVGAAVIIGMALSELFKRSK